MDFRVHIFEGNILKEMLKSFLLVRHVLHAQCNVKLNYGGEKKKKLKVFG